MKSDINNIKAMFVIGKILGITPIWLRIPNLLSKLYISLLICVVISGTGLSINKRYATLNDLDMSIDQAFLESSDCLSEMLFMVSCYLGVTRTKAWRQFFHNFVRAEEKLHRLDFKDHGRSCVFAVRILVVNLAFFAIHAYEIIIWIGVNEESLEYGYILYRISMYYQFFTVYVMVCIIEMLKKRYAFLNKLLEEVLRGRYNILVISSKDYQSILGKLRGIQTVYAIMYRVVKNINCIFGWTLLFYFTTFVINILVNLNYVMKFSQTEDIAFNLRILLTYIIYSIVYTISTVAIVMTCDSVEQSGKKIVKVCFLYQELQEKSLFKDELMLFARFAKELAPVFSAAGFFQINQSVLSGLFSAITTYLIIIIQFNMSLK